MVVTATQCRELIASIKQVLPEWNALIEGASTCVPRVLGPRCGAWIRVNSWCVAEDGRVLGARVVKLDSATAWQRGTVVIDDLPVSEALTIMNRCSNQRIVAAATWRPRRSFWRSTSV